MKIKFKNPEEHNELIAAMADARPSVSMPAQEVFAERIGPLLALAIPVMGTSSSIFNEHPVDEGVYPTMPVDPYFDAPEGTISVWSQTSAGGLPTNLVGGYKEIPISMYELDSAINMEKRVLRASKIPLVERHLERMGNEVLIKRERNNWAVVMATVAPAVTQGINHCFRSATAGVVQMQDFNDWIVLGDRINAAFNQGTPADMYSGLTDVYASPEFFAQIRSFVYQPMNTRSGNIAGTDYATSIPLPDSIREQLFKAGGNPSLFDVEFHKVWELGTGNRKYNLLFSSFTGGKTYYQADGTSGGATFATTSQVAIGVNKNWNQAYQLVEKNGAGSTFTVLPDDQYVTRQQKVAFYGFQRTGNVTGTPRQFTGLIW